MSDRFMVCAINNQSHGHVWKTMDIWETHRKKEVTTTWLLVKSQSVPWTHWMWKIMEMWETHRDQEVTATTMITPLVKVSHIRVKNKRYHNVMLGVEYYVFSICQDRWAMPHLKEAFLSPPCLLGPLLWMDVCITV